MVNQAIHMVLLNPFCLALIFIGVVIGIIFGSIPGLSASMALILFLPMSFGMEPMNGIALLVGLYLGGISGGTQSILSFNFGAGNRDRVLKAQKEIVKLCVGYTALLFVLARVAGPLFVALFNGEGAVAELSLWAIRVCTAALIPLGVQYEIVDGFTAMGQVRIAFSLSFFRKLVYFAALFLIPVFGEARYAFWAEPVSDIIAPVVSIVVYRLTIHKVLDRRPAL